MGVHGYSFGYNSAHEVSVPEALHVSPTPFWGGGKKATAELNAGLTG